MEKKIKVLFHRNDWRSNMVRQSEDEYGGIGYYRIVKPAEFVNRETYDVDIVGAKFSKQKESKEQRWKRIFETEGYDIFWCSYFIDAEEASAMFYYRDKCNKKVIIDLDDNYLDTPKMHNLYDRMKEGKRDKAFLSTILSFADVITVSTEPLRQRLQDHMKKVYNLDKKIMVIPNMNDKKIWDNELVAKNNDKIVIGYAGSNSHYEDLQMMLQALAKIMDKYPNVYFESMGALGKDNLELFVPFSNEARMRCDILPSTWTFKAYPKHLASMKWDIAVAPLIDSAFTRSKSHIKFLEYACCKLPIIASKVYPYYVPCFGIETIKHEETGLLIKPSEWFSALEDLILHKDKRQKLGENAYNYVLENWQYNDKYADAIDKVLKAL